MNELLLNFILLNISMIAVLIFTPFKMAELLQQLFKFISFELYHLYIVILLDLIWLVKIYYIDSMNELLLNFILLNISMIAVLIFTPFKMAELFSFK